MQKYEDNLASRLSGNALQPLALVEVRVTDDATGLPAAIYSDDGVTPLAQPLITDNNGGFAFYAANGEYTLTFSGASIATFTRKIILDDPSDNKKASLAELAAPSGSSLIGFIGGEVGATTQTVQDVLRDFVSIKRFGAVGNGTVDDTAAVEKAIASGRTIDLCGLTLRITSKLVFNQPGQTFRNGTLLFDGANTTRLLDLAANDLTFTFVTFDGNGKQPAVALGYIRPNVKRPRLLFCTTKNLVGPAKGTNALNHMYGWLVSPYGVEDFRFHACTFQDISKYNDGATGGSATVGGGFCGGMYLGVNDDLAEPVAAQPIPTSGKISDCIAVNIQTIRAVGLSLADSLNFDDADGIRFYGHPAGASTMNVEVSNFTCRKVSKRGIKVSVVRGVSIDGLKVDGRGLPYPPCAVAKLESGTIARNLVGVAGSADNQFYQGVELNGGQDVLLDGLNVDYCAYGWLHDCVNDTSISNVLVRGLDLRGVSAEGFRRYYHAEIASASAVSLEDSRIVCTGNTSVGILSEGAADGSGGLKIRNVEVVNGEVNIQGYGADVDGLRVKITSGTYAGYSAAGALVRIGPGLDAPGCVVNNLHVDASGIKADYLSGTRQWLVLLYSDQLRASNISLTVPEGLSVAYPHFDIVGHDLQVDGLTYHGPGCNNVATVVAADRWVIRNAARTGSAASTSPFFRVNNAGSQYGQFEGVTDFRPTTAPSIEISAGANFMITNVSSRSSNVNTVSHAGLAKTANIQTF